LRQSSLNPLPLSIPHHLVWQIYIKGDDVVFSINAEATNNEFAGTEFSVSALKTELGQVGAVVNAAEIRLGGEITALEEKVEVEVGTAIDTVNTKIDDLEEEVNTNVAAKFEDVSEDISSVSDAVEALAAAPKVTGLIGGDDAIIISHLGGVVTLLGSFGSDVKVTLTLDGKTFNPSKTKVSQHGDRVHLTIPKTSPQASRCVKQSNTGIGIMLVKIYKDSSATDFATRTVQIDTRIGEFGDGRDGDLTINKPTVFNSGTSQSYPLSADKIFGLNGGNNAKEFHKLQASTAKVSWKCGDAIAIFNMGSYYSDDKSVGAVAHAIVQSVSGAIITLQDPISATVLDVSKVTKGAKILVQRVPQYQTLTINGAGSLKGKVTNFGTQSGVVAFKAHKLVVDTTAAAAIDVSNIGFQGGKVGSSSAYDAMSKSIQGGWTGTRWNQWSGRNRKGGPGGGGCGVGKGGAGGDSGRGWAWGGTAGANWKTAIGSTFQRYSNRIENDDYNEADNGFGNMPGGGGGGGGDYSHTGAGGGGAHCSGKTYSMTPSKLTLGGGAAAGAGGGASDYNGYGGAANGKGGKSRGSYVKPGANGGQGGRGGGIAMVFAGELEECCGKPGNLFINAAGGKGGGGGGGSAGAHKDGGGGGGQGANGAAGGAAVVRIGEGKEKLTLYHLDVAGGAGGGGGGGAGVPNQHNPSASGGGGAGAGIGGGGGGGSIHASYGCAGGTGQDGYTGAAAKPGNAGKDRYGTCKAGGAANGGGGGSGTNGGSGGKANMGGKSSGTSCNKGYDAPHGILDGGNGGYAEGSCGGDGNRAGGGGGGGSGGPGQAGLKAIM
jgi:hypothetical protein